MIRLQEDISTPDEENALYGDCCVRVRHIVAGA